jgi:putative ABC transport system permease protein
VAGQPSDDIPGVSVEGKVAESLKLKLGDHMVFSVGGVNREARVTSLREINWDNFQPNFFMIFQPGTLKDLPATYLTSFYLAPGHDQQIVELSRAFPAVTILQVEALLRTTAQHPRPGHPGGGIRAVVRAGGGDGGAVLRPAGHAGRAHSPRRAVARTGRERQLLVKARRIEFGLLGAVSGLLAAWVRKW